MTLLYNQLVANPHIDTKIKQRLRECIVIEATNVSDYYFQGTDQEVWKLSRDFPNIAPPFNTFFLEFRAPQRIISEEHGIREWHKQAPLQWGILFDTQEINEEYFPDLMTEQGRTDLRENTLAQLQGMQAFIDSLDFPESSATKQQKQAWYNHLPEGQRKTLALYMKGEKLLQHIDDDEWDEVAKIIYNGVQGIRWILNGYLFTRYRTNSQELGPDWGWIMNVQENGTFKAEENGDVNVRHTALGRTNNWLASEIENDGDKGMQLFESRKDENMPFLHTALLAVSFMHCKNVTLKETKPERAKPLTNRQRRRGMLPRQYITYHVLDIEPMKQVLKTEGQSEKVGIQRSLHICRGHFAHYSEDKKLFGKYAGTFWKPQHVRGSMDVGIAAKDYHIKKIKGMPA